MQDISDQLDINTYLLYQYIDVDAFSRQDLKMKSEFLEALNRDVNLNHPQVEEIEIVTVYLSDHEVKRLCLQVELVMKPTLYRSLYSFNRRHQSQYSVQLPIDGDNL